jgi:Concanavalin A-like lectin/glucanases superfamily
VAAAALTLCLAPATAYAAGTNGTSSGTKTASSSSSAAASSVLTQAQASAQARKTGKAVPVTGETTDSSTLTANANGTYTLTQSTEPVRKFVGGSWKPLDATLVRGKDGTISPETTTGDLSLSGGGTGTLAAMSYGNYSLALTLPSSIKTLPSPTLSGASATYADVLPGVNLVVTATTQGSFSEVFEVENATAAAGPALAHLEFGLKAKGVTVSADTAGNLSAATKSGQVLFHAAAPTMWDSATSAALNAQATTDPTTGVKVDARTGTPVDSSAAQAGGAAHTAPLGVSYRDGVLDLTPNHSLLTSKTASFPQFIDPSWTFEAPSSAGSTLAHTYVSSAYPSTSYWNETSDFLHVGYTDWDSDYISTDRSFYEESLNSQIWGSTIISSTFYDVEEYAASCSARDVALYQTGTIDSGTDWNNQPSWNTLLDTEDVAHGWDSSCPAASVPFSITSEMQSAASGHWSNITLGLRATDESDDYAWKKFANSATITTTFDKAPVVTSLSNSRGTSCAATQPEAVGLGDVMLYAKVSSPMGTQNPLGVAFQLWPTATGSDSAPLEQTDINTYTFASGTTANYDISQSTLSTAANDTVMEFSWRVRDWDGDLSSNWSTPCDFYYDAAIPGSPVITATSSSYTLGTPATFDVAPTADSTAATPVKYSYQLNTAAPITVSATAGDATITLNPTRMSGNTLTVNAESTAGNIGGSETVQFDASEPSTPEADKSLNSDGIPDLLLTGQTAISTDSSLTDPNSGDPKATAQGAETDTSATVPAGLWYADGQEATAGVGNGLVDVSASDIGTNGNNGSGQAASSFTGEQVITGQFEGDGLQDVLTYDPSTTAGEVIQGNGDGEIIPLGEEGSISAGMLQDPNSDNPMQLANAYDAAATVENDSFGASFDETYPDLIAINGDDTTGVGYYLDYYEAKDATRVYNGATMLSSTYSPDGTMDWQDWTISTTEIDNQVDLVLWDESTGALDVWQNLTLTTSGTLSYTPYILSGDFEKGTALATLEPGDITGAGSTGIGVWAVTPNGAVTSTVFTGLTGAAAVTSGTAAAGVATVTATADQIGQQTLSTPDHAWQLDDQAVAGDSATSAADSAGNLALNGNGGVTGSTSNLFDQDTAFDGSSGYFSTASGSDYAVAPNGSFTVSAWVNPAADANADDSAQPGTVLSQNGETDSGLILSINSGHDWQVALNTTAEGSAADYDDATGGTALPNIWTHIVATFDPSTGLLELYVNGTETAVTRDSTLTTGTGRFMIGADQVAGLAGNYFEGELADVQTWNTVTPPVQPSTTGADFIPVTPVRLMDTRSGLGGTTGPVTGGSSTTLKIEGNTTASLPTTGITAVALSITVTSEANSGFIAAYPDGSDVPVTSTVNYLGDQVATNDAIVPVGSDGDVDFYNYGEDTQLIVDLTGYFSTNTGLADASTYVPLTDPTRILSTINGVGAAKATIAADSTLTLAVAGNNTGGTSGTDIPADASGAEITGVAITLTPSYATAQGQLIVYPGGGSLPGTSNETYQSGGQEASTVIAPVGSDGDIEIYNSGSAAVNLDGDVSGYYTTAATGELYHPVDDTRLVDTRLSDPDNGGAADPVAGDATLSLSVPDNIAVPNPTLVLDVVTTAGTGNGVLTVYPNGQSRPSADTNDWIGDQDLADLALATAGGNEVDFYNNSSGTVQLIIDVSGYFAAG